MVVTAHLSPAHQVRAVTGSTSHRCQTACYCASLPERWASALEFLLSISRGRKPDGAMQKGVRTWKQMWFPWQDGTLGRLGGQGDPVGCVPFELQGSSYTEGLVQDTTGAWLRKWAQVPV